MTFMDDMVSQDIYMCMLIIVTHACHLCVFKSCMIFMYDVLMHETCMLSYGYMT